MIKRFLKTTFKILLLLTAVLIVCAAVVAIYVSGEKLNTSALSGTKSPVFFDIDGKQIQDGLFMASSAKDLSPHVYNAFIAIEDKNFYSHKGVDARRMAAAAFNNAKSLSLREGASTISQQLIKNTQLSPEKTLLRKAKEIKLALDLEKSLTKQQIIDSYLNVIYFGNGCYGIENAAKHYFNISASQLDCGQAAALAAIIKSPTNYSPYSNPQKLSARKDLVLTQMKKYGLITQQDFDLFYKKQIIFCVRRTT